MKRPQREKRSPLGQLSEVQVSRHSGTGVEAHVSLRWGDINGGNIPMSTGIGEIYPIKFGERLERSYTHPFRNEKTRTVRGKG